MKRFGVLLLAAVILGSAATVLATVSAYCLDTSGSMNKENKIAEAKAALLKQIEQAKPGDVLYVISFAINEHLVGRLEVGEDGSPEAKADLIARIRKIKAGGPAGAFTNLDEAIKGAEASLFLEPAPGERRIIVITDGISAPSVAHEKLDLKDISSMIPQGPGWALYIVGVPEDIASLFHAPQEDGVVVVPEHPHVVGIPIEDFSRDAIDKAITTATEKPAIPPTAVRPAPMPIPTEGPTSTPIMPPTATALALRPTLRTSALIPWLLVPGLLAAIGLALISIRRNPPDKLIHLVLVISDGNDDAPKRFSLALAEMMKKTVGPRGDIPLSNSELPPIVCSLEWNAGEIWVTPQDTITVNSEPIDNRTAVRVGDIIRVRQTTAITIEEPQEEQL